MFHIENLPQVIFLGRQGENAFRTLSFDVSPWLEEYPGGSVSLVYERPDGAVYVAAAGIIASPARWTPGAADTEVPGEGRLEIRLTRGEVVGKSMTVMTRTEAALGDAGEPPAPGRPDWMAALAEKAGEAAQNAEEARGYAQAAQSSADLAVERAEAATASAELAQACAESAQQAADEIEGLADAARNAALDAQESAVTVSAWAESAQAHAAQASESAGGALSAKTAAEAARDVAGTHAAIAQAQALDARVSAENAAFGASNAAASAMAAGDRAAAAENAAAVAVSAVTEAQSFAGQAADSAGTASGYAREARDAAAGVSAALEAHDASTLAHDALFAAKAPLNSPAFTGVPTAPTAAPGANTAQIATTAFVQAAVVAAGGADMLKSVYDSNGDGVVNAAEKLGAGTYKVSVPALTENKTLGTAAFTDASAYEATGASASAVNTHNANAGAHSAGIAGNAATATKLKTARTIFGKSFDGSADITDPVPVANGGTGATAASDARTNLGIGSAGTLSYQTTVSNSSSHVPTGSAVVSMLGRSSAVSAADTNYGTVMVRGIYAGTTDMTPGSTALTSGVIYCVYE